MQVANRRRLRKQLHQVLEDWISEELGDSSDDDESNYVRNRARRSVMDSKFTDQSSAYSHDGRTSSRLSSSSTATDHLPPPPKYESVIQRPVKDYSNSSSQQTQWEKEINQIVGDFDKNCSTRDGMPAKRLSSGTQSYVHEEKTSRSSVSPSASASAVGGNLDWDKDLLSNDSFFRDSPFRQRLFADRPFGTIRSRFGEDIDRFFGRGTFSTDWDTFFPEITFSDFGRSSSALRNRAISNDTHPTNQEEDFKLEVDVQGFEPHELLVKTVGHSLVVLAKMEASDGNDTGISKKREFRELRKEFTIPAHINPTDISSNLTPDGMLVIEAPAGNTMAIQSRDDERKSGE